MSAEPVVQLTDVTKAYGGAEILRGVSLSVGQGERLAIMGPSGSGKTTLLSIMGLVLPPDKGTVLIASGLRPDATATPDALIRNIGWVFQTSNALLGRSIRDNVAIPLMVRGISRDDASQQAEESLRAFGLHNDPRQRAADLSGGELQRMCIARAVVSKPLLLLADEPTGQLDGATTADVLGALHAGIPALTALVVVTHDREVAQTCERIVELRSGALVAAE